MGMYLLDVTSEDVGIAEWFGITRRLNDLS